MDGKAAGVAAQVQHPGVLAIRLDAAPVFLLVQKVAGFLSAGDVHQHTGLMFQNFDHGRHMAVNAAGVLFQTFFFPDGYIVAGVDALRVEEVHQNAGDIVHPLLHAQADALEGEIVPEFVHRQPRQAVGLTEDHPAGVGKSDIVPVFPGGPDAPGEKVPVDGLLLPGQYPDQNLGAAVEKAPGQELFRRIHHIHDAAVGVILVHPGHFVVVDPVLARFQALFLPTMEAYLGITHKIILSGFFFSL